MSTRPPCRRSSSGQFPVRVGEPPSVGPTLNGFDQRRTAADLFQRRRGRLKDGFRRPERLHKLEQDGIPYAGNGAQHKPGTERSAAHSRLSSSRVGGAMPATIRENNRFQGNARENEPIYRFNRLHSPFLTHSRRPGAAHIELHHDEVKLL